MSSQITMSGFNNIDFKSIVTILMQQARKPVTTLQSQQQTIKNQLSAYQSLNSNLTSFQSAIDDLADSSSYGSLGATSSDTSVATVSTDSGATRGTFTLTVDSLARPQVTASAAGRFSDMNAAIFDGGSFSFTQNGTTTSIDMAGEAVDSLADLRDAINRKQTGVQASIINDGSGTTPFRLVLTSTTPGTANAFTVNDQTTYQGGSAGQVLNLATDAINGVAKDTQVEYNGITIKGNSNVLADAIPGVTLTLNKTGSTVVTITNDDSVLKGKIQSFVDAFNSFDGFVKQQTAIDPNSSSRAPLATDTLLRTLNRQIRDSLTSKYTAGDMKSLSQMGITLGRNGKLTVDDDALSTAISNNRAAVQNFFSDSTSGLSKVMGNLIDTYTGSGGTLATVQTSLTSTIDRYSQRIDVMEQQLVIQERSLNEQFTAADQAISQLNNQASSLSGLSSGYRLY